MLNISTDKTSYVFEEIVRHIVEFHGCRTVNFMAGIKSNEFSEKRIDCYRQVLSETGIEADERRIGYGDFWETPTIREMNAFMESGLTMPEAIICANDSMVITVCRVHVSVGAVSMTVSSADELEEFLKAADKKMYEHKRLYKASKK